MVNGHGRISTKEAGESMKWKNNQNARRASTSQGTKDKSKLSCIIKYIKVKVEDNVSDIKCPAANCNQSLEPLSCRPKITRELFNKWCDVLYETTVLKIDRAYCPNRKCSVLILNECARAGGLKRCVCPYCKKPFCFRCKVPWHAGFSCDESRMKRDENDVAFGILSEKKMWRRCPGCRYFVERISGCDIIKCRFVLLRIYLTILMSSY
ncbi:probable E3 ubiquitin-protein ligase RNF217 [Tanacetum coccineum]